MKQVRSAVDLLSVVNRYGTDDQCREYLTQLRWPDGVECPKCQSDKISRIKLRNQYDCDSCRYQFSVMSGTMFHDTHLALTKWFFATYIICESRKGVSANQLKRMLRVSYETAWYLCHRIRAAMKAVQPCEKLGGTVEVDETYVGGHKRTYRKAGFGDSNKEVVIGIRQRGGDLRFFHAEDAKSGTLARYIRENVSDDVDVIITDEYRHLSQGCGQSATRSRQPQRQRVCPGYENATSTRTRLNPHFRCSSAALSVHGIGLAQSICRPTLTKCAFVLTTATTPTCSAIRSAKCWKRSTLSTRN